MLRAKQTFSATSCGRQGRGLCRGGEGADCIGTLEAAAGVPFACQIGRARMSNLASALAFPPALLAVTLVPVLVDVVGHLAPWAATAAAALLPAAIGCLSCPCCPFGQARMCVQVDKPNACKVPPKRANSPASKDDDDDPYPFPLPFRIPHSTCHSHSRSHSRVAIPVAFCVTFNHKMAFSCQRLPQQQQLPGSYPKHVTPTSFASRPSARPQALSTAPQARCPVYSFSISSMRHKEQQSSPTISQMNKQTRKRSDNWDRVCTWHGKQLIHLLDGVGCDYEGIKWCRNLYKRKTLTLIEWELFKVHASDGNIYIFKVSKSSSLYTYKYHNIWYCMRWEYFKF